MLDAKGRELDWGPAPIGPEIPDRVLRESSPSELGSRQAGRAAIFARRAASWRPFEAVLTQLPTSADRFELGVSDAPAS